MEDIFKAYDVRGRVGTELTVEVARKIGATFADFLPDRAADGGAVAVGRDMRPDSKALAEALIEGITRRGRDVWDIGQVTSDMIYFATGKFGLAGGAVVTASHNPGEYNGIKFCREEAKPVGIETGLAEIRDAVFQINHKSQITNHKPYGKVIHKNVIADWIKHVLSFIGETKLKPYKIAVDAGNGMAGAIVPELAKHVPFKVIPMYFELDGTFPNHIANPLELENLQDIIARVKEEKCDLGIAFDGDGDRAVLIDENGRQISGTIMTALLARYFLEKYPKATVLHNAICGRIVPETIKKYGGRAVRTKVGHSFIKDDMRSYKAVFAGEHSGHYYFKDNFMADSGLIAAIVAVAVLSRSGKTLSALADEFDVYEQIPETNFEVADKQAVIEKITREFADGEQDRLDGLTVNYPDYWFNVRPSNTEPLLRLNAEAKDEGQLRRITAKVTEAIKS